MPHVSRRAQFSTGNIEGTNESFHAVSHHLVTRLLLLYRDKLTVQEECGVSLRDTIEPTVSVRTDAGRGRN